MERLTKRDCDIIFGIDGTERYIPQSEFEEKVLLRLAELEDKLEQGTLIELPCKVGDTVYVITANEIEAFAVNLIIEPWEFDLPLLDHIGRTVFLTQAEAQAELEKRKHNNY